MRLSNLKKNTERKYDEINPSSSLEYVHETFCPLLILDEMGDCTCYTCPKNTGTTDNLAWTSALLNEFCIAGFTSSTGIKSWASFPGFLLFVPGKEREALVTRKRSLLISWMTFWTFFEPDDLFGILCLQACDKAAIMVVHTNHFFENLH